jgi:hypothetical protein
MTLRISIMLLFSICHAYFLLIVVVIVFLLCSVSFIVCVVLCAVFRLIMVFAVSYCITTATG